MASETIACLSVRDPWARAIAYGLKDVENRSWFTCYRGPLLIHTSLKPSPDTRVEKMVAHWDSHPGCIIGVVTLINIRQNVRSRWAEQDCEHWMLQDARPFHTPIPYKGMMGLFYVPRKLVPEL